MALRRTRSMAVPAITGATLLLAQVGMFLFGDGATKAEVKSSGGGESQRASGQAATTLCTPIFGSGKSAGIPIKAENVDGSTITDLSPYTFELSDGTNTQDVTSLIQTPAQQPLIVGQNVAAEGNYRIDGWGQSFKEYGTHNSATGPSLDFTNPGYFFLGCTPDGTNSSVKFASGITLRMKSAGSVVASVSLAERAASLVEEYGNYNALLTAVKPTGSSNTDFEDLYRDFITSVGVRFRTAFASTAIMELSGNYANTTRCWNDLAVKSGSTWSWTAAGQAFLDELTSINASSWPILAARTKGQAGPVDTGLYPCDLTFGTNEDEFFTNALIAQLVLIDGPLGNVPSSVRGSIDSLAPASVLRLTTTPTTTGAPTTTTVAPTTTTIAPTGTSVARRAPVKTTEALPRTGKDTSGQAILASALFVGGVVVMARRRRITN